MINDTALWSSLPVPALLLDGEDIITASNSAAETFLNLSAKALHGAAKAERHQYTRRA